uniref:Ig-like domain-containing protein n=1 Tax=Poecilia reticulata TaxID=8081 RepID=A0A3P9PFS1_POERE
MRFIDLLFITTGLSLAHIWKSTTDELNRTAEPGQDVILPCEAPGNEDPEAAEWKKQDDDEWLIYLRPNQSGSLSFGSSYEDRVDLQDRQLKNGNASLVLRNVTTNDSKTYECRVGRNRSMELITADGETVLHDLFFNNLFTETSQINRKKI